MASLPTARWLALLLPAALLGGALVSQYVFGLYPCEMCMWQRWPHLAAIVFALLALALRSRPGSRTLVIAAALSVLISGLIGGFHAGVEYGWWEGFTSCSTNLPAGGDLLDSIMNAPLVRCDVAPWSLFGISLAGYNFLLSAGGAIAILALAAKGRRNGNHG
ncbi:disulfide bond formation protein B [Parasphingorhabdus sp.]|uniref:disulfide bond formation protein B n=1 Tax=Parasphingorhabdus sp. TaxID=2709688 RepID=UPI0030018F8E